MKHRSQSPVNDKPKFRSKRSLSQCNQTVKTMTEHVADQLLLKNVVITPKPLANYGNTCFVNAIMQCFNHTVPLVAL
jgi:ubiquitin C-terminal hydrolase